ncbi:hypothetical protein [Clostridium sp. CCUG 7971]|uniref:hypothetical protein n=1 Tax=Clostridium sp. CCUG 7971 TaxID=2811414 RepID=UPI001ABA253E|nr:hypothetical protein [Clostridium sp. CCUG 7971]MBO3444896.1 hypothetical protein [Clostridium sp. CCUG 7971]
MKRIYYLDSIMMAICTMLYFVFFKDIKNIFYFLIFSSYILYNAYIISRLRLVKNFDNDVKMSPKFSAGSIYLFLGKLLFIPIYVYDQENTIVFMLFYFMIMSFLVLEYTYIDDNKIIKLSGKYISLKDISSYRIIGNYNEYIYLDIYCNSKRIFNCSPSKKNFDLFIKEQFENHNSI